MKPRSSLVYRNQIFIVAMTRFVKQLAAFVGISFAVALPTASAQQTAVVSEDQGNKVYLKIEAFSLRANLDTLFAEAAALQGQIDNLSWADVLVNGTTPGVDVNFFGYDATGIGNVTTTGTFTGDSLVLNKDATVAGRLDVTGVTTLGDSLLVAGTVVLSDSLRVVQATSIGSRLHVSGVTAFGDSVHVVGNVDLDALFNVDGAATFGSTMEVAGVGTFRDTLNVDGATLLNDSLNVDGNTYLEQDLQVDGNTNIGGTVNITGAVTLGDALSVTGKTSLGDSLLVSGGANFASGVNVDGNTTLNDVRMDGDLDLNGNADISGALDVTGATTLSDSLVVNGQTLLNDTLKVNAPTLLNDSLHVAGGSSFGSNVTVDGATSLGGTLNVTGNTSLGGTLGVTGVVSLADSLHVTGGADFDSGLNVDGNATLNNATISGTATLQGELTANGEVTYNDTVHFNEPALFADSADFAMNVNVGGTMSVSELIIDGVTIPALDNTDALPEGDTNLYFTAAREAALQAQLDLADSLTTVLSNTLTNLLSQLFTEPTVTTAAATPVSAYTASINATFDAGGAEVEDSGFILSLNSDLSDSTVYAATGSGSLAEALSSLTKGTTYYYRAFIETIMGRAEGSTMSFTTVNDATVSTSAATLIEKTTARLNGSVTGAGGGTVSASGFQWGTSNNWASASTASGSATSGSMNANLTGLSQATTYYFRAFATNEAGTVYGSQAQFTTDSGPCVSSTVTFDGYTYNTVEIGSQCWFQENLRSENFRNGDAIPYLSMSAQPNATSAGQSYPPVGIATYGRYYNYWAATSPKGLCPTGWHVPTASDWNTLASQSPDWFGTGANGFNGATDSGWASTGQWILSSGANFWTSQSAAESMWLFYGYLVSNTQSNNPDLDLQDLYSVRCVQN